MCVVYTHRKNEKPNEILVGARARARERESEQKGEVKRETNANKWMVVMFYFVVIVQFTHIPIWKIIDLTLWHFAASHFYGRQLNSIIRRKHTMRAHTKYKSRVITCKVRSSSIFFGAVHVFWVSAACSSAWWLYVKFYVWNVLIVLLLNLSANQTDDVKLRRNCISYWLLLALAFGVFE